MSEFKFPEVSDRQCLLEDYVKVERETLTYPNGMVSEYTTLSTVPRSVSIVATTQGGEVVFLREYRHPVKNAIWCLPGGMIESGESAVDAARRELLEETGYGLPDGDLDSSHWRLIGRCYPLPGLFTQEISFIRVDGVVQLQKPTPEPSELLESVLLTREQFFNEVLQWGGGDVIDGTCSSALFFDALSRGSL
ncbi:MAG: NUDIX hydrolase [Chlamydiia bacterium]|nr:NUDIX hydrolase [Chlamydiia bacterium]